MTVDRLIITVVGTPAPQGSKRHIGGGRMVESSKAVGPWRETVAWRAHTTARKVGWTPTRRPYSVTIEFRLAMPKSRRKTDRVRGWCWSTVQPDLDKLARSTLDALVTGGALIDDAHVTHLRVEKLETTGTHSTPGATIIITPTPDPDTWDDPC